MDRSDIDAGCHVTLDQVGKEGDQGSHCSCMVLLGDRMVAVQVTGSPGQEHLHASVCNRCMLFKMTKQTSYQHCDMFVCFN